MNIRKIATKTLPLCFMPDGSLLCYKKGQVVLMQDGKANKTFSFPISAKEKYLGWSRLISRLLRFGIRAAGVLDDKHVVLSLGNMLYEMDVENGEISKGWYCGDGIRPLQLTMLKGLAGFTDGMYFGGYLGNMSKKPVHVYRRVGVDQWEIIYTFPQGAINHVHNIVADPYRKCLWVFTGDFEEAAAIWKVTDDFKNVERVRCNDQKWRSDIVYPLEEGLLYATDAPFADDYIYLLNPETLEAKEIFPIHGSCIYGCQWKDKFVFSSTVEGDGRNMSRLEWLFTRKRGAGIKDNYVHMYMGNLKEGFREIYKEKKDCMPFYTFQFGVFKFPAGVNNTVTLYFQPVATKKNDLRMMSIKQDEI